MMNYQGRINQKIYALNEFCFQKIIQQLEIIGIQNQEDKVDNDIVTAVYKCQNQCNW